MSPTETSHDPRSRRRTKPMDDRDVQRQAEEDIAAEKGQTPPDDPKPEDTAPDASEGMGNPIKLSKRDKFNRLIPEDHEWNPMTQRFHFGLKHPFPRGDGSMVEELEVAYPTIGNMLAVSDAPSDEERLYMLMEFMVGFAPGELDEIQEGEFVRLTNLYRFLENDPKKSGQYIKVLGNGNRQVTLIEPLKVGGAEMSVLTLTPATVGRRRKAYALSGDNKMEMEMRLYASMAGIEYDELTQLSSLDYARVQTGYRDFLSSGT